MCICPFIESLFIIIPAKHILIYFDLLSRIFNIVAHFYSAFNMFIPTVKQSGVFRLVINNHLHLVFLILIENFRKPHISRLLAIFENFCPLNCPFETTKSAQNRADSYHFPILRCLLQMLRIHRLHCCSYCQIHPSRYPV